MNSIKVILALLVVALLVAIVIFGSISLSTSDDIQLADKTSNTTRIEGKIDSLSNTTDSIFCDTFYEEIKDYIEMDFNEKRLGTTLSENEQWKKILSNKLYRTYTNKVIEQAFYLFKKTNWREEKLSFIRIESQKLQEFGYDNGILELNTYPDKKLKKIKKIFQKYDEISKFINKCNSYKIKANNNTRIIDDFSIVTKYIKSSKNYLYNNLENSNVNNCQRLKLKLRDIPQKLFNKFVKRLENKVKESLEIDYDSFENQRQIADSIINPLKKELLILYEFKMPFRLIEDEYGKLVKIIENKNMEIYKFFEKREIDNW